jgi:hypothetical protein
MNITRRNALVKLAGGASLAAVASSGQALASLALPPADNELVALAIEITMLRQQLDAANKISDECYSEYNRIKPKKPTTLLWRVTDPVSYSQETIHAEGGKQYLWCSESDIEKKRRKQLWQYAFLGTADEYEALGGDAVFSDVTEMKWPVKGSEQLWERWPQKRSQRRLAKLVQALDEYKALKASAWQKSGIDAADAVGDAILEKIDGIYSRMCELRASTLEGFRAQMVGVIMYEKGGKIKALAPEDDGELLHRLMSSLTGIPIESDEGEDRAVTV